MSKVANFRPRAANPGRSPRQAIVLAGAAIIASSLTVSTLARAQTAPVGAPATGDAGMKVYVDPQTGAVLPAPPQGAAPLTLTPDEQNRMSTSHEGLVETPADKPGGGFKLDLKGRFQSPLMATTGPDGRIKMHHLGESAEPHSHN